ncbi:MAG: nitroreductase family protein [Candidatus Gastranaerophilales bacterium]|nr:nitroreductase family protein [Candidatus Gastranaerophilales bacterium]
MNEVIQNILNRRSIRIYSEEQIKQEDLDLILQAGMFAPSACNFQSWHFTVIQNKEIIKILNDKSKNELKKSDNENFKKFSDDEQFNIFYNASTIIVVSGDKKSIAPEIDCAAATENIMLAAESIGIGTCWIGLITPLFKSEQSEEILKLLQIPENYEPYYAITLGYKKGENPKPQPRRDNVINYIR